MTRTLLTTIAAFGLAFGLNSNAQADSFSGSVQGSNTIDYVMAVKNQGDTINLTVSASGRGSNKLTVKVQQQRANGSWSPLRTMTVRPGSTRSLITTVRDYFSSSTELVRYRLSRKALTKRISYNGAD